MASQSRQHRLLAAAIPRVRRAQDLTEVPTERARLERAHREAGAALDRLPTVAVPGFGRRYEVVRDARAGFPTYVVTRRGRPAPQRTLFYVHGGGFVSGIDPFHVRYACRLGDAIGARIVLPAYPLTPEHTWKDSHDQLVDQAAHWAGIGGLVLAGDSAGGGLALAVALSLRDRARSGGTRQADRLVLHAPWADLTTSTPETFEVTEDDPWLFVGKLTTYADWWAGSIDDLTRPEVSPALGDLSGLPPGLMFHGTRDTLAPGCRLLTRNAEAQGWALTTVERPDLLHCYTLFPGVPEAREDFARAVAFLS